MGKLEDDVRAMMIDRAGSIAAFARLIGKPGHTLYSALDKGLEKTTLSTIIPICTELGIDPTEIAKGHLSYTVDKPKPVFVPLYGSIAAGTPIEMQQVDDEFPIPAGLHAAHPNAFMLRIEGNSMNRVLPNGFLALIEPCASIDQSGQIYAVTVGENNATVKRVILHDNGLTLQPDSDDPTYSARLFNYCDDTPVISVVGRVVWWCSPTERSKLANA